MLLMQMFFETFTDLLDDKRDFFVDAIGFDVTRRGRPIEERLWSAPPLVLVQKAEKITKIYGKIIPYFYVIVFIY